MNALPFPILVIVGPTGAGKSAMAIAVAERAGGEIVTADSTQVYRGCDIGTDKPTLAERRGITHYGLDIADPRSPFTVAEYVAHAEQALADIHARGRAPILSGGTGLYIQGVLAPWGFARTAPDEALRARYYVLAAQEGKAAVHARLAAVDAESAAAIHPNNLKRVVRALEVYELTGQPLSHWKRLDAERPPRYQARLIGLTLPRELLYRRIDERVHAELAKGLLDEVKRLLDAGVPPESQAMHALGYRQLIPVVRGEVPLETAVYTLQRDTRHFARRQFTWFRRMPAVEWLDWSLAGWEAAVTQIADIAHGLRTEGASAAQPTG